MARNVDLNSRLGEVCEERDRLSETIKRLTLTKGSADAVSHSNLSILMAIRWNMLGFVEVLAD